MRAFVATLPPGEAERTFFWVDGLSIDEHQGFYGDKGEDNSEVWAETFKEAVRKMGNTVMVLAPWDQPVVLTRCDSDVFVHTFRSFRHTFLATFWLIFGRIAAGCGVW